MPELPDVETFKKYLDSTALHKKIKRVRVTNKKILKGVSPKAFSKRVVGNDFKSTERHGKYLFVKMSKENRLMLHFGMTGKLQFYKDNKKDLSHARVVFDFTKDSHLAFINRRLLGKVGIIKSVDDFIEKQDLGPDAMEISKKDFVERLSFHKGSIKSLLMNQKVIAGIGNIYADEILFQAGIHPKKSANRLKKKDYEKIYSIMRRILRTAIRHSVNLDKFPGSYLLPNREEGERCPDGKGKIKKIKVSGRSTYYCPSCQKK